MKNILINLMIISFIVTIFVFIGITFRKRQARGILVLFGVTGAIIAVTCILDLVPSLFGQIAFFLCPSVIWEIAISEVVPRLSDKEINIIYSLIILSNTFLYLFYGCLFYYLMKILKIVGKKNA